MPAAVDALGMTPESRTESVLRGAAEACCCEVQEISATGARLRLATTPPAHPLLLSFQLAGEHVTVPVGAARDRADGSVAVSFARVCQARLTRLIALAA